MLRAQVIPGESGSGSGDSGRIGGRGRAAWLPPPGAAGWMPARGVGGRVKGGRRPVRRTAKRPNGAHSGRLWGRLGVW